GTVGWEAHRPVRFSADGKLVIFSGRKGLDVYDTAIWKPLPGVPGMPQDLTQYAPTKDDRFAVVGRQNGALELWDLTTITVRATLDKDCFARFIEFSPDQSRVAITSEPHLIRRAGNDVHLRVFDLSTAKLVHELRPFDVL